MSYIRTHNGLAFDYLNPKYDQINIDDIALALSHIPRWLGHTGKHYPIAQHCCWCYDNTTGNKLEALMHDASEAYVGDCPTPLKALLPDYQKIEDRVSIILADKYKYNYPYSNETHIVDKIALAFERHFVKHLDDNYLPLKFIPEKIIIWSHKRAKREFLKRFNAEMNGKII
jgi:uncharacterized protein